MANSPREDLLRLLRTEGAPAPRIEDRRAAFAALADSLRKLPAGTAILPVDEPGVVGEWISTTGADSRQVVLFLHAGGFSVGSPETHRDLTARIALASGIRVFSLAYRLAPEHPFPAALEDAIAAYRWLLAQDIRPAEIAVVGASAGGGLALSLMVALRDRAVPLPAAVALVSPWTDLSLSSRSIDRNAPFDPHVRRASATASVERYVGADGDPREPLVSPVFADLRGLPPMLFQVGLDEAFLDDSLRCAARARRAGVDVDLDIWEDMIHIWPFFAKILPEGQEAIDGLGAFLRRHTPSRDIAGGRN